MEHPRIKLGELLITNRLITREQLSRAIELQKKGSEEPIGAILVRLGFISEQGLAVALSEHLKIPYVSREKELSHLSNDKNLSGLIPEEFARKHCVLPLVLKDDLLTMALVDPLDIVLLDSLRKITGHYIERVIGTRSDIEASISEFYGEGGMLKSATEASYTLKDSLEIDDPQEDRLSLDDLVTSAEKPPVIQFTDLLIRQAIKERASDIHIEPFENRVTIRFRVDGVLHEIPPPEKSMVLPIISRIKILAKINIAEKRLPQDGSFRAKIEDRLIDFRVSTVPTIHGEKMVIRILDRLTVSLNLEALNFTRLELEIFREVIHKPYGMILLTGPTGSGKTTTLYAALNEMKSSDKNIMTIEDPVEYEIIGINQVQVKPQIGLTFAKGLRSFLRQDPDVILVGEIRDLETAQICVRAALTGHLVFSTLHTNDAPTSISRLIDIGIEPYFIASSLLMTAGQRLLRRLCPACKEAYTPAPDLLPKKLKYSSGVLYRPRGCKACAKTGYHGRTAIFEIMRVNDHLEELIAKKAPIAEIRAAALKAGMVTLEESAYQKVLSGDTSLEEAMRVTLVDFN